MLFTSVGFVALLVVPALDHRFGWSDVPLGAVVAGDVLVAIDRVLLHIAGLSRKHVHLGNHPGRQRSEGHFDRTVRNRPSPDVRERGTVSIRHAVGVGVVLGVPPDRRDDAIPDLAPNRRGTLPRQEPVRICRIPETSPTSSRAVRLVTATRYG